MRTKRFLFLGFLVWDFSMGCAVEAPDQLEPPELSADSKAMELATADQPTDAPLVASVDLPNGNTLEFYDFGEGALISEAGTAANPEFNAKALKEKTGRSMIGVLDIWNEVAPTREPPKGLRDLDERMKTAKPKKSTPPQLEVVKEETGGSSYDSSSSGPTTMALSGCNNRCCDYDWLSSLSQCKGSVSADASWFLFNYGWSYANFPDVYYTDGLVCAASGTSTWRWKVGGNQSVWSVTQGNYRTAVFVSGFCPFGWCDYRFESSVNTSSQRRLHTYCGTMVKG